MFPAGIWLLNILSAGALPCAPSVMKGSVPTIQASICAIGKETPQRALGARSGSNKLQARCEGASVRVVLSHPLAVLRWMQEWGERPSPEREEKHRGEEEPSSAMGMMRVRGEIRSLRASHFSGFRPALAGGSPPGGLVSSVIQRVSSRRAKRKFRLRVAARAARLGPSREREGKSGV